MKNLIAYLTLATAMHAEQLASIDLEEMADPTRIEPEVRRVTVTSDNHSLVRYVFLKAVQPEEKPPLHVLCAERDYISSYVSSSEYHVENPEALFNTGETKVGNRLEPSLDPIHDSVLMIFDEKGQEIRPFGGNNYIDRGYIFDFDGDGILDRADSTNYGVKKAARHEVQGFKLSSIESEPRTLLKVIYNWHPNSADDANRWTFECYDEEGDGIAEIAFGPASSRTEAARRQIVFRFDKGTGKYSAGMIPEDAHVHVVAEGETLDSIADAGGIGYPLIGPDKMKSSPASPSATPSRYVYKSLKGQPTDEVAAFFTGQSRHSAFDGAKGSFPSRFPDSLFEMPPKQAAMVIAAANRTPTHAKDYQLAIDDRGEVSPPASGWMTYSWQSSGCYSLSMETYAIRFGGPDPVLIAFGYNSIGIVGRNPWADQPAHNVRIIPLSEKEARFLASTVFWLERIRSQAQPGVEENRSSSSSTADGSGQVCLFPTAGEPQEIASETVWVTASISGNWVEDFDRTTFVNLADLLVREGIPETLEKRWETTTEIEAHNLATPTGKRLEPRVDDQVREQLATDFKKILEMHTTLPIPPELLLKICNAAGDEGLVPLLPDLEKLHDTLPPVGDEDREFEELQKRFARDHFGNRLADKPEEHKKAYARLEELRNKRRFEPAAILRAPLVSAITRLRLASDPALLIQEIDEELPEKTWALSQLRRTEPGTWAIMISKDFNKARDTERQMIFSTLANGHPPAGKDLISNLPEEEKRGLILEIAAFHREHEPESFPADLPLLLDLAKDTAADSYRRANAMKMLSEAELPQEMLSELRTLLVSEIRNAKEAKFGFGTLGAVVESLMDLPEPSQHLDLILSSEKIQSQAFQSGFKAVAEMTTGHADREGILADYIRPQFETSRGMMNSIFTLILAENLLELAPEIAAFATAGPDLEDGDGANYSGGNFKSPVGERYHIAREITALWSERDPATLARMWIAFVSAHPIEFETEKRDPGFSEVMRKLASTHIRALPEKERRNAIAAISKEIPVPKYYPGVSIWLASLAE